MLRGQDARSKMRMSYSGVRKKVAKRFRFKYFKAKNTLCLMYLKAKTTFNVEKRYLEIKKQEAKHDWFISRSKLNNQSTNEGF